MIPILKIRKKAHKKIAIAFNLYKKCFKNGPEKQQKKNPKIIQKSAKREIWNYFWENRLLESDFENRWGNSPTWPEFNPTRYLSDFFPINLSMLVFNISYTDKSEPTIPPVVKSQNGQTPKNALTSPPLVNSEIL